MIILKATTESLQMVTSSTATIDYSISYADLTPTTFAPSSSEGSITTATTTTVLAAPAASTQRQVKLLSITNRHATLSSNVYVHKRISSTNYVLMPTATLLAGETMQYLDGQGWIYYASSGAVKTSQTAPGSDTQIMFNNAGVLTGDAGLTWTNSTDTLLVSGTNAQVQLGGVSAVPAVPNSGTLSVYSQQLAGKMQLMKQGPSGDNEAVQASLWQNNIVLWTAGGASNAGTWWGSATATAGGSVGAGTLAVTNPYTAMRRSTFGSVVTTVNQSVGLTSDQSFWRGNSAGLGGFYFVCRFGFNTWTAGDRLFVGLMGTNPGTLIDPTSIANNVGFVIEAGDTAISFMTVDNTTTVTKTALSGQPTLATNNGYDAYIYAKPNDTAIYYRLENALTGTVIVDGSQTTNLPLNSGFMYAKALMSNGANTTANSAVIGINRLYIETNR